MLKLEISDGVIISSRIWFLLEGFQKIIFWNGGIFESFCNPSFDLKIVSNINGKATVVSVRVS